MKELNLLSKAEMKNVIGGGCPAWYQAQCIAEASNGESTGNPAMDEYMFNMIMEICMSHYTDMPDNP